MLKKIKSAFLNVFWVLVFIIGIPFVIFKFIVSKPFKYVKLKRDVEKQRKEVKEVLKSNEDANKIIDSLYNDWNTDYKSFKSKLRLYRARQDNK